MKYSDVVRHNMKSNPWFVKLWKIIMTNIDIEGLSPEQDKRFILKKLIEQGKVVAYNDETLGQMLMPCILSGKFNVYEQNLTADVQAVNGYHKKIDLINDGEIIYADYTRCSLVPLILYYSEILSEIDKTIMLNVNAQKTPYFVEATNETADELRNILHSIDDFRKVIVGHKSITNSIEIFNTDAPYVGDKLTQLKIDYLNEFLSQIGINNSNISKMAQIQTAEINANNEYILVGEASFIDCLNECFEKANRKLNTEYKAVPRVEFDASALIGNVNYNERGDNNGNQNENID